MATDLGSVLVLESELESVKATVSELESPSDLARGSVTASALVWLWVKVMAKLSE